MKTNNSDLIQILQDINNHIIKDSIKQIDDKTVTKLIKEKALNYISNSDDYLSYVFLKYKNLYYPLFFFKIRRKKNIINLINNPILCKLTISLLKDLGINEKDIHQSSDIQTIIITLIGLIEKNSLPIKLNYGLSFYSTSHLILQDIFDYANLLHNNVNQEINISLASSSNYDFSNYIDNLNNYLKENNVAKIVIDNNDLYNHFLLSYIDQNLLKENVLLLCLDEEEMKKYYALLSLYFPNNILTYLSKLKNKSSLGFIENLNLKDIKIKKENQDFDQNLDNVYNLIESTETIYTKYHLKDIDLSDIEKKDNNLIFEVNTLNYKYSDLQKDESFLKTISDLPSIINSYINDHVYYGLDEKTSIDKYEEIINLIINIKKLFFEIKDLLKEKQIKNLSNEEITNIKELETFLNQINVLNSCPNKIDLDSFLVNQKENINDIEKLIDLYHNLSARKLVIQTLTRGDSLSLNLQQLINDYYGKNLVKKIKAYRIIFNSLITRKNKKAIQLIKIIRQYLSIQRKINELIPIYKEKFGDRITNLGGIKELEQEFKYIERFNNQTRRDISFSINNPLIRNFFTSNTFKENYNNCTKKLKELFTSLESLITQYINYFIYDMHDFVNPLFDENISFFDKKLKGTKDEFIDYLTYLKAYKNTSNILQLAIKKSIIHKTPLINLTKSFISNLSTLNFKEASKEINKYKNDLFKSLSFCINHAKNYPQYMKTKYKELYIKLFNETKEEKKKKSTYFDELTSSDLVKSIKLKRLVLATKEDLIGLDDEVFDNLIVSNNIDLNSSIIVDTIRVAKKTLFIDLEEKVNSSTQEYFFANYKINNLLKNIINFDITFDQHLINALNNQLSKNFMSIEMEDFYYLIDKKRKKKYILLPSNALIEPLVSKELYNASNFISHVKQNIPVIILDTIKLRLDFDNFLKDINQIIN